MEFSCNQGVQIFCVLSICKGQASDVGIHGSGRSRGGSGERSRVLAAYKGEMKVKFIFEVKPG